MQIKISTRHGNLSDETRQKITEKVEKLSRLFDRLSSVEVTVDLEHRDTPVVDLKASAKHKHDFVATNRSENLMGSVDQVVEKMEQQLRKHKEKIQDRHRGAGHRQTPKPGGNRPG